MRVFDDKANGLKKQNFVFFSIILPLCLEVYAFFLLFCCFYLSARLLKQNSKETRALSEKKSKHRALAEANDNHEPVVVQDDDDGAELTINDLPKELLVSVFIAVEDPRWVRHTVPLVSKEWAEL